MNYRAHTILSTGLVCFLLGLSACGTEGEIHYHVYDPSDAVEPGPTYYYVSGSVVGLSGSGLALELNDDSQIQVAVDGSFGFVESPLEAGMAYEVTVHSQPASPSQVCVVSNGSGTIGEANIETVEIVCTDNTFRVGGLLSGLAGEGLTLSLNETWELSPEANGDLTFNTAYLTDGTAYEVVVTQQPEGPNQTCAVENGQGVIAGADITSMEIRCVTNRYTVGGTLSGLNGTGLVLKMASSELALEQNGAFEFSDNLVEDGRLFEVTVAVQPVEPAQICSIENGGGMIAGSSYTGVIVDCVDEVLTKSDDN
jgi:hypothetical protein